jgi:hypothetical protein
MDSWGRKEELLGFSHCRYLLKASPATILFHLLQEAVFAVGGWLLSHLLQQPLAAAGL